MPRVNRLFWMVGVAVLLLVAGTISIAWKLESFMAAPVTVAEGGSVFEITPGSSFGAVTGQLADAGIISTDFWYRVHARLSKEPVVVQAGEYNIEAGTTARELLAQFAKGVVRLYSFTIIEGWNHRDLLAALHANENVDATMSEEDWPVLLAEFGASVTHPEGLFLPETYHFPRATSDREVLRQAYELMQQVLDEEWQGRAETPVDTPYEALILASIVEKETALPAERPRIAGVFARRLDKRMRLQTDPTVIYGIGAGFNGNLTRKDLRTDTPYNTYTRHGLPPTPIAMPGRAAINAALHPADGEELFFVATGLGDGSHKFSTTKAEHDAAVAEYLQRLRNRKRESR